MRAMSHVSALRRGLLSALGLALPLMAPISTSHAFAAEPQPPLRACFDPDDLPFSREATGTDALGAGYYIDLAHAVADRLGRPLEPVWIVMQFAGHAAREALLGNKCDAFFALPSRPGSMGPKIIFSRPILAGSYALVTAPGMKVTRLADLAGKKVAVQFGTPPQGFLAAHDGIEMVTRLTPEQGFTALATHEADGAILWGPSAGFLNQTRFAGAYQITPLANADMQFSAAIGFAAKEEALRDAVDQALVALGDVARKLATQYGMPEGAPRELAAAATSRHAGRFPLPPLADTAILRADDQQASALPVGNAQNGREIINTYCSHCHGPDARAPVTRQNLHLLHERYGDQMDQVFITTVHHGRPDKGMPNWSGVLTEKEFADVLAYLHETQDTPEASQK